MTLLNPRESTNGKIDQEKLQVLLSAVEEFKIKVDELRKTWFEDYKQEQLAESEKYEEANKRCSDYLELRMKFPIIERLQSKIKQYFNDYYKKGKKFLYYDADSCEGWFNKLDPFFKYYDELLNDIASSDNIQHFSDLLISFERDKKIRMELWLEYNLISTETYYKASGWESDIVPLSIYYNYFKCVYIFKKMPLAFFPNILSIRSFIHNEEYKELFKLLDKDIVDELPKELKERISKLINNLIIYLCEYKVHYRWRRTQIPKYILDITSQTIRLAKLFTIEIPKEIEESINEIIT